ncbi:YbhN family protein [Serratia proteamaculans]
MERRNKWALAIILLIGASVFFWEFRSLTLHEIMVKFRQIQWSWIIVAIACMLFQWAVEAKIVQGLLERENFSYSFKKSYRIPLIQHLFNSITPFASGGQPAQLVALKQTGVDIGIGSSVLLMKFVVYQGMIVVYFGLCVLLRYHVLVTEISRLAFFVILGLVTHILVIAVLLLITFKVNLTKKIVHWLMIIVSIFMNKEKARLLEEDIVLKVDSFYHESLYIRGQTLLLLKTALLTAVQLAGYFIVPYFILLSLGIKDMDIITIICMHAFIVMIVSLFPIPGGSGGAEYGFTLLFGSFILSPEKLAIALLLWRLITYYLGILLGAVALGVTGDSKNVKDNA